MEVGARVRWSVQAAWRCGRLGRIQLAKIPTKRVRDAQGAAGCRADDREARINARAWDASAVSREAAQQFYDALRLGDRDGARLLRDT